MDEEKIEFTWYVDDGFVTGDRPQEISLSVAEVKECGTLEAAMLFVGDSIKEEFNQSIGVTYSESELEEAINRLFPTPSEAEEGE